MLGKFGRIFSTLILSIIAMTGFGQSAHSAVIDFESLALINAGLNSQGQTYSEDGFTLDHTGANEFRTFGTLESRFVGSTSLINDSYDGLTTLTRDGGGAFSLVSIDLNELNQDAAVSVEFTGITSANAVVSQTFTLDGIKNTVDSFFFNALFADVVEVSWLQGPNDGRQNFHQFDNINLSAVPLPAAFPLYATGLLGFGFAAYRKRRKSAA